jgi:hypothetical protein
LLGLFAVLAAGFLAAFLAVFESAACSSIPGENRAWDRRANRNNFFMGVLVTDRMWVLDS